MVGNGFVLNTTTSRHLFAPSPPVPCAPVLSPLLVTSGGFAHLCVETSGTVGLVTLPVLDIPLLIRLENSFVGTAPSSFQASLFGGISTRRVFTAPPLVFPSHVLIVSVAKGIVTSMDFEQGCALCGGDGSPSCAAASQPLGSACAVVAASKDCIPPSSCDLHLTVVFHGTDAQGRVLLSSARRPSLFQRFSADNVGDSLRRLIRD